MKGLALLVIAAAMAALGLYLRELHDSQGPPAQRVNIRWASTVSSEERLRIEQDAGLRSARHLQDRTWNYLLADRSRGNIGRLLHDPRVEDTFQIDRESLMVRLDRPDLAPWLRGLLETDWVDTIGLGLILVAVVIAVLNWRASVAPAIFLVRTAKGAFLLGVPATDPRWRAGVAVAALDTTARYRPDVDGLRAVAVAGVVAYHAFPAAVPGGFTGVDIFFVISGYLISSVVLDAIERREFTLGGFFARRVRRLFPALATVVCATLVIAWFVMLGADYMRLGRHAAAAEVFAANIAFWRESGYFDVSANHKPLLHLWSLGVEEQFYLTWPLIVLLSVRRRRLLPLLATLCLGSFVLNVWTVSTAAAAAFYLPHTRAWELLAGAFLACVGSRRLQEVPLRMRDAASVVGVALIAAAFVLVRADLAFPGWWALMPVGGAFLLVLAGSDTWITRQLARRPVVWVGLISYPLYLWHWPLLSLARSASRTEPSPLRLSLLIGLSVVLAWLTYRFVERPIRFGRWRADPRAVPALATASALIALTGAAVALGAVRTSIDRSSTFVSTYTYDYRNGYRGQRCQLGGSQEPKNFDPACVDAGFGQDGTRSVLIWGDSHAAHLYPGLHAIQRQERLTLAQFTRDGCEPVALDETDSCGRLNAFVVRRLPELQPDVVILAASWGSSPQPRLPRTLDAIRRTTHAQVIVVGAVPGWGASLPAILASYEREHPGKALPAYLPDPLSDDARGRDLRLRRSFDNSGVTYVSALDAMCRADGCLAVVNGALTAWDGAHLTDEGSKILAMALLRAMRR